ncbi:methyltransferase [Flavihumibacter sp. CACIAM 22H1]|uniref:tRNA1(Val) (adenine(37)-N6)-methyltransferase n=1 Tax=Flavihumibacter sp. CACIAM 22H1 TaxID=1812911 RepID=UPI0025C58A7A|nr:methyltransferase [Flavihumibacter sp. CACIAM 22H1]
MKVCTESCLFGAWLADFFRDQELDAALDIGTGTGLLSLQLAQQVKVKSIDAIELDPAASKQATANFQASAWNQSLHCIQGDVLNYSFEKKYRLVFSNPPFFEQSLLSADRGINLARHEAALGLTALADLAANLLEADGWLALLLPYLRADAMVEQALKAGLTLRKRTNVCQTEKHGPFRSMLLFKKDGATETTTDQVLIRQNGSYSAAFTQLLQPYYLYL